MSCTCFCGHELTFHRRSDSEEVEGLTCDQCECLGFTWNDREGTDHPISSPESQEAIVQLREAVRRRGRQASPAEG